MQAIIPRERGLLIKLCVGHTLKNLMFMLISVFAEIKREISTRIKH